MADAKPASRTALPENRRYRTRNRADDAGPLAAVPERLAIPIRRPYLNAFTGIDDPAAHLICDTAPDADMAMLKLLYAITLYGIMGKAADPDFADAETIMRNLSDPRLLDHADRIFMPDVVRAIGHRNHGDAVMDAIVKEMESLRPLEAIAGGERCRVVSRMDYDAKDNTLVFSSPYFNRIIPSILEACIETDGDGKPVTDGRGGPSMLPHHSFLARASIVKERNKRATEIACNAVALIEQTDRRTVRIQASKLAERCPGLQAALRRAKGSHERGTILRRSFGKAWQLLETRTDLSAAYAGLELPKEIPDVRRTGREIVFRHDGRNEGYIDRFYDADVR